MPFIGLSPIGSGVNFHFVSIGLLRLFHAPLVSTVLDVDGGLVKRIPNSAHPIH